MILYKTIEQFAAESGYTPAAIRTKIHDGIWTEGVWIKAPDNRVLISIEEFNLWAINIPASKHAQKIRSKSLSPTRAKDAEKRSKKRLQPLI
jgi:hypothetical protein